MDDPAKHEEEPTTAADEPEFSQAEIDALLSGEAGGEADTQPASRQEPSPTPGSQEISQEDVDALLGGSAPDPQKDPATGDAAVDSGTPVAGDAEAQPAPDARVDTLGRPFDEAAAAMEAAIEEEKAKAAATAPTPIPAPPPPLNTAPAPGVMSKG